MTPTHHQVEDDDAHPDPPDQKRVPVGALPFAAGSATVTPRRFGSLSSVSAAMDAVFEDARSVASSPLRVFLTGETGTGKTVLAQAIHEHSLVRAGQFVHVDVTALSESVLESELFGHVKGAFTGAISDRDGVLMAANGGTLFLDEVGNLSREAQQKLLIAIDGSFTPVGSTKRVTSTFRSICATNADVKQAVRDGRLLADFVYRMGAMTIEVPPLRDRPDDVAFLARDVVARRGKSLSPAALELVLAGSWPGNARELLEHLDAACTLANGVVEVKHVRRAGSPLAESDPQELERELLETFRLPGMTIPAAARLLGWPASTVKTRMRMLIRRKLLVYGGNQSQAARALGWSRSSLRGRMAQLDIAPANPHPTPIPPGAGREGDSND